jgi:hypothetical protein
MRPTEEAGVFFGQATSSAFSAGAFADKNDRAMQYEAKALNQIANGLEALSRGMRATYILLEEVKKLLERQNNQRLGP